MLLTRVMAAVQEVATNLENWQVVAVASIGLLTYSAYRHHVTKVCGSRCALSSGRHADGPRLTFRASVFQRVSSVRGKLPSRS